MTKHLRGRIDEYRRLLTTCSGRQCESVFQKVADRYEDDLLELEAFEEEYFQLVLDLLSKKELYSKPGVWNFLLVLSTEQEKMQPRHYGEIATCIVHNYGQYQDEDLCLSVCDFIARNYPATQASEVLNQLAEIESRKAEELRGFVEDGLRILAAEEKRRSAPH